MVYAQMCVLGSLTVNIFGVGITLAEERASPWHAFVRTLPAGATVTTVARVVVTSCATIGATVRLWLTTLLIASLSGWPPDPGAAVTWLAAGLVHAVAGAIPLLGIALAVGATARPASAVTIAQIIVVPLGLAGGLLVPPDSFPSLLQRISQLTPTRAVRDSLAMQLGLGDAYSGALLVFAVWSLTGLALAVRAYRRDEGQRFG